MIKNIFFLVVLCNFFAIMSSDAGNDAAYQARVKYYEQNVFRRPLTAEEKKLYCGHLLEKRQKTDYQMRVEHYEQNVFKRPLTQEERELYCGHLKGL